MILIRIIAYTKARVMNTKLTLTIEKDIIQEAKQYAKEKGRSLSDIVENYLKAIVSSDTDDKIEITPMVKSLQGSIKLPKDFDYKSELKKRLSEKYQ